MNERPELSIELKYNHFLEYYYLKEELIAFCKDNNGNTLEQAIKCWKYKKSLPGHNRYEVQDLYAIVEKCL